MADLRLYGFCPNGLGLFSFYVMAESPQAAADAVRGKIRDGDYGTSFRFLEDFHVEVVEACEVLVNYND